MRLAFVQMDIAFTGRSRIVAPRGVLLHRAGEHEPAIHAVEIDPSLSRHKGLNQRHDLPGNRRPAFYRMEPTTDSQRHFYQER